MIAIRLAIVLGVLVLVSLGLRALARPFAGDDLDAVRAVARDRTQTLTDLAHGFSWLGRTWVLLVIAAAATLVRALRTRQAPNPALVIVVLGADLLQNLAKWLADRPRPPVPHLEHVTSSSFPSGHATQSAAFAVALVMTALAGGRQASWRAFGTAALAGAVVAAVAASRVYLGVHYPTDVLAGLILGAGWGAGVAVIFSHRP